MKAVLLFGVGVGVLALILVIVIVAARRRTSAEKDAAVMKQLRERALTADEREIGVTADGEEPWGVIMETGYPGAAVSLVAFDPLSTLFLAGHDVITQLRLVSEQGNNSRNWSAARTKGEVELVLRYGV
jgi:hypothetical protein